MRAGAFLAVVLSLAFVVSASPVADDGSRHEVAAQTGDIEVRMVPPKLHLEHGPPFVQFHVTGDLSGIDPGRAEVEGGIPATPRNATRHRFFFIVDRTQLADYFLQMDPARIVAGYRMEFTMFRPDGTPVRAAVNVEMIDPRPSLLATASDGRGGMFLVGRNLHGPAKAWSVLFDGVPGTIEDGPKTGHLDRVGPIHVLRVTPPVGAAARTVALARDDGAQTNGRNGTAPPAGSPTILFVIPSSVGTFWPVSVVGTNFDQNAIVWFDGTPTLSILSFNTPTLPIIGQVSEIVTLVPPGAQSGPLYIEDQWGRRSNGFPMTIR